VLSNGHDEDGDGIDDACDNCPAVSNLLQSNSDLDQIGDECEYGAVGMLSKIAGLTTWDGADTTGWVLDGKCTPGDDYLTLSYPTCSSDDCYGLAFRDQYISGPHAVESVFRLAPSNGSSAGIVVGLDPSSLEAFACELTREGGDVDLGLWFEEMTPPGDGDTIDSKILSANPDSFVGVDLRMVALWDGNALTCTLLRGAQSWTVSATKTELGIPIQGRAGVMVWSDDATFESFVVYTP